MASRQAPATNRNQQLPTLRKLAATKSATNRLATINRRSSFGGRSVSLPIGAKSSEAARKSSASESSTEMGCSSKDPR